MNPKTVIRKMINHALQPAGYALMRKDRAKGPTLLDRLQHMKRLGFAPKVILDGGAFVGGWTVSVSPLFPQAMYVLVEPNPTIIEKIKENVAVLPSRCVVLNAAIGDKSGTAELHLWGDKMEDGVGASLLPHIAGAPTKCITVTVLTLDEICAKQEMMPDFVKLDLQGGELAALKGARTLLGQTELFMLEFGCLDAYVGRATPRDLMDVMYDHGYGLYGIVDLHTRPFDDALTGGDFFFVHKSSTLKAYKGWV